MFLLSDEAKSIQSRYSLEAVMENGMLDSLMLSAVGIQSQTTQLKRSIWGLEERKTPFHLCVCVCFRLGYVRGGRHAPKPFSLGKQQ